MSAAPNRILGRALRVFLSSSSGFSGPLAALFHGRYRTRYRFAVVMFTIDLIIIGCMLALTAAIAFLSLYRPGAGSPVRFAFVTAPSPLRSGDAARFVIHYENSTRRALRDAIFAFRLPAGLQVEAAAPALYDRSRNELSVGSLAPGARGELVLDGLLVATPDEELPIAVSVSLLRDRGERETFLQSFRIPVGESAFTVALEAPDTVALGEEAACAIRYEQRGAKPLLGALIASASDQRAVAFTDAIFSGGSWRAAALEPGVTGAVPCAFRTAQTGVVALRFRTALDTARGHVDQRLVEKKITVVDPRVALALVPGAEHARGMTLQPDSETAFTVVVENKGTEELKGATLSVSAEPEATVIRASSALDSVPPGGLLRVPVTVIVPSAVPALTLRAALTLPRSGADPITVHSERLEFPIAAALSLSATAQYYSSEGEQLGRGPLPPRVGHATTYWATATVRGGGSRIRDVVLEAVLGAQVRSAGIQSTNAIPSLRVTENGAARLIRFTIPELAAGVQGIVSFSITVTPTAADVGRPAVLLSSVRARGRDAATNLEIKNEAGPLTTDLVADPRSAGKGIVLP